MAEPKAKTLQERFGFLDADLKKPKHDEIMKWVDDNIEDILMVAFSLPNRPKVKTTWEQPVRTIGRYSNQIIGFVDMTAKGQYNDKHGIPEGLMAAIEVKTEISSLGELIRQIRMYKEGDIDSHGRTVKWLVIAPDDSHATKLEEQGIHFFMYGPKKSFLGMGGL